MCRLLAQEPPEHVERRMAAWADFLALPSQQHVLQWMAGLQLHDAQQHPLCRDTTLERCRKLPALLSMPKVEVVTLILFCYKELTALQPEALAARWARLRAILARHRPWWHWWVRTAPPLVKGRIMAVGPSRMKRLEYLLACGPGKDTPMPATAVHEAPAKWLKRCGPAYDMWCADPSSLQQQQQQQQQQVVADPSSLQQQASSLGQQQQQVADPPTLQQQQQRQQLRPKDEEEQQQAQAAGAIISHVVDANTTIGTPSCQAGYQPTAPGGG